MSLTSFVYLFFLGGITITYWIVRNRTAQNILLLVGSYVFYGWFIPWYCLILASSTCVTYLCLHWLWNRKEGEKELIAVIVSILWNIGILVTLKYWNFWIPDIITTIKPLGLVVSKETLQILIPIGISFYMLQAVGITIDAYRGDVEKKSFLSIAVFLSFFPKLIAGPFEKAQTFLTQIEQKRTLQLDNFLSAFTLILFGFLKKLVVAENIKVYVDQIFVLAHPSPFILIIGGIGFTIQILADFSAYTDIARGSARLLGFELIENFKKPYLSISPSDFWSRWHISLSQWFRDYIYIPLGGSRNHAFMEVCLASVITMAISGIWHGTGLNFLVWGLYQGLLLSAYRLIGLDGHWTPLTFISTTIAWLFMMSFTVIGWIIFRSNDLVWLIKVFINPEINFSQQNLLIVAVFLTMYAAYSLPWIFALCTEKISQNRIWIRSISHAIIAITIIILGEVSVQDFIYANF